MLLDFELNQIYRWSMNEMTKVTLEFKFGYYEKLICGIHLNPIQENLDFPFVLIKSSWSIWAYNYVTKEVLKVFECKGRGLLNQKLLRITCDKSKDNPRYETFITTILPSNIVRFTIDKQKLVRSPLWMSEVDYKVTIMY